MYNCEVTESDNNVANDENDSDANTEISESNDYEYVSQSDLNSICSQSSESIKTSSDLNGILQQSLAPIAVEGSAQDIKDSKKYNELRELFEKYVENTNRKLVIADKKLEIINFKVNKHCYATNSPSENKCNFRVPIMEIIFIILGVLSVLLVINANYSTKYNSEVEINASDDYMNDKYFEQYENHLQQYQRDLNNTKTELNKTMQWLRIVEMKHEINGNNSINSYSTENEQIIQSNVLTNAKTLARIAFIGILTMIITFISFINLLIASKIPGIQRSVEYTSIKQTNTERLLATTKRELENTKMELKTTKELNVNTNTDLVELRNILKELDTKVVNLNQLMIEMTDRNKQLNNRVDGTITELINAKIGLENTKQELNARIESISLTNNQIVVTTRTDLETTKTKLIRLNQKTNELSTRTSSELHNTKLMIQKEMTKSTPPGTVAYFACETEPDGWLKANGQLVSRTTYANLFAKIGSLFGSGDGKTTFNLPNLCGEFFRELNDGRDMDKDDTIASIQSGSNIPKARYIKYDHNKLITRLLGQMEFDGLTVDNGFEHRECGQKRDGEKYGCTHCERQFIELDNLRRHLSIHSSEQPYACELCPEKFSDSDQLKSHMLIHNIVIRRRFDPEHHKYPKAEDDIRKPERLQRNIALLACIKY